jgi:D-serine dehydratase
VTACPGLPRETLAALDSEPLGPRFRNIPAGREDLTVGTIGAAEWRVDDLLLPTLTLRRTTLQNNAELFAQWCGLHGVDHAPHGKTSMAPRLFDMQLAAGAWAITAATVAQARLMHEFGVPRVLLANEVLDPGGLRWIAEQMSADPGWDVCVLVDSAAAVQQMDQVLGAAGATRVLPVLLELGVPGGRAGVRSVVDGVSVARRVQDAGNLVLAGVECFEGVYPQDRSVAALSHVDKLVAALADLCVRLDAEGLFGRDEVVLTAGGSAYPDRFVSGLREVPALSRPVRRVVRSGGYLTHDHGSLEQCSPLSSQAGHSLGALRPALELWAQVLSTPEPDLAICGFGKRDAPFDSGLPMPLARVRGDGTRDRLPGASVDRLNDQHAFLRHAPDLAVGDIVLFGLSHPCTAFDKWPLIPVLDDADHVTGAVRTYF